MITRSWTNSVQGTAYDGEKPSQPGTSEDDGEAVKRELCSYSLEPIPSLPAQRVSPQSNEIRWPISFLSPGPESVCSLTAPLFADKGPEEATRSEILDL